MGMRPNRHGAGAPGSTSGNPGQHGSSGGRQPPGNPSGNPGQHGSSGAGRPGRQGPNRPGSATQGGRSSLAAPEHGVSLLSVPGLRYRAQRSGGVMWNHYDHPAFCDSARR